MLAKNVKCNNKKYLHHAPLIRTCIVVVIYNKSYAAPMYSLIQKIITLRAHKAHKFVCTVIWTVEFYAWTYFLTGGIDSFQLRNQEGSKSANHAE